MNILENPPPYQPTEYSWVYSINRNDAENYLRSYIKFRKLGLHSDRLFLVRYKNVDTYVISVYRYIPNCIYHYLLEKKNNYFLLSNSIIINISSLDEVINYLINNLEIGYQLNNEIMPLCNSYAI